tara:strand:+ start:177 stop:365 length:189 start_codon:yes stop_codon:yes gene_type:complete
MGVGEQAGVGMFTVDDFRVGIAAVAGLTSWAVNIDVVVQLLISIASLTYIVLKIIEHFKRKR